VNEDDDPQAYRDERDQLDRDIVNTRIAVQDAIRVERYLKTLATDAYVAALTPLQRLQRTLTIATAEYDTLYASAPVVVLRNNLISAQAVLDGSVIAALLETKTAAQSALDTFESSNQAATLRANIVAAETARDNFRTTPGYLNLSAILDAADAAYELVYHTPEVQTLINARNNAYDAYEQIFSNDPIVEPVYEASEDAQTAYNAILNNTTATQSQIDAALALRNSTKAAYDALNIPERTTYENALLAETNALAAVQAPLDAAGLAFDNALAPYNAAYITANDAINIAITPFLDTRDQTTAAYSAAYDPAVTNKNSAQQALDNALASALAAKNAAQDAVTFYNGGGGGRDPPPRG